MQRFRHAANEHFVPLLALVAVTVAALWFFVSPRLFDLHEPIIYAEDGLSYGFLVKTLIDVGWYPVHTPWVGAPFGSDLFDYPFSDGLNFILIRLLAIFSSDWVVVANSFYLSSYFLAGISGYFVLRRFGAVAPLAVAGALAFTLLPYHWLRPAHLLLASYFVVPIGIWLAFLAWQFGVEIARPPVNFILPALCVLAVGSGGAYYAFFSAFLVAAAGLCRALAARSARRVLPALVIVAGIAATVTVNVAPTLVYHATHGANPTVASRHAADAETYGLRLTQLLLPHVRHRTAALREVALRYSRTAPLVTENMFASLGLLGDVGLTILLLYSFIRIAGAPSGSDVMNFLAAAAAASFLLGTIGGIGSLFAYIVTPLIRGYNRISIFIGFVSLAALVMAMQSWIAGHVRSARSQVTASVAILAILIGTFDQTPNEMVFPGSDRLRGDRNFVHTIEQRIGANAMVWQMPYQPFPESSGLNQTATYEFFRGYLNSRSLRWSYGAMKGREADRWIRALAAMPPDKQLDFVARSGFSGVYLARRAYADGGAAVEAVLRDRLGPPIAESPGGDLVAYAMQPTGNAPVPFEDLVDPIFDVPIRFDMPELGSLVAQVGGLSVWEPWGRWTDGPTLTIILNRVLPRQFDLRIETAIAMKASAGVDLGIRIGSERRRFRVEEGATVVSVPFDLPGTADVIEIDIPNPQSPRAAGINDDGRLLGIGLKSITVKPREK